jgi:hypothetical protein
MKEKHIIFYFILKTKQTAATQVLLAMSDPLLLNVTK